MYGSLSWSAGHCANRRAARLQKANEHLESEMLEKKARIQVLENEVRGPEGRAKDWLTGEWAVG